MGPEGDKNMLEQARSSVSLPALTRGYVRWGEPPWRLTMAGAALLGYGLADATVHAQPWWRFLALAVLVDTIWGAWWHLATALPEPAAASVPRWLPYVQADAPWARWYRVVPRGVLSGLLLTGLIGGWLAWTLGPRGLWASLVALILSLGAAWFARVWPAGLPPLAAVYGLGLPLWAGAYIAGPWTSVGLLAAAIVVLAWSRRASPGWRILSAIGALSLWTTALLPTVFPPLLALTLVCLLFSAFSRSEARARTLWLGALLLLALHRMVG